MKTVEMLSFCPKLCPALTDEQREDYMSDALGMINNPGSWQDHIVDKGHCFVVKVPCRLSDKIPATVIKLQPWMESFVVWEYSERPIEETNEYPYPTRHLPKSVFEKAGVPQWTNAGYLHVILYTREQLKKEGMEISADYGMVTINAEEGLEESPMAPHSLLRNVDTKYGGNGQWEFDHDELAESFRYYATHIRVK